MDNRDKFELRILLHASIIPLFFLLVCWSVFAIEHFVNISLGDYGLVPRSFKHIYGIFTMPFLHANISHIIGNTVSFLVLGTMVFYFYDYKAPEVFMFSYIGSGLLTWLIARGGVHVGASAMIYAFAAYLFTVGVRSRNKQSMAISLIVVFLYGSLVWGLYPQNTGISWEGHLAGAISGVILAFIFPDDKVEVYDIEDDDDFDVDTTAGEDVEIEYYYKDKPDDR